MGIIFKLLGSSDHLRRLLDFNRKNSKVDAILDKYGEVGVGLLAESTPKDSGETANSWNYRIVKSGNADTIQFYNTHENKGVNIAIILQYGHGTRNGGYVQGRDYINPASREVFEQMAEEIWTEVISV